MKVLMFGWEFPPHISGGLGTACYGLTKGLAQYDNVEITFVVPNAYGDEDQSAIKLIGANRTIVGEPTNPVEDIEKVEYIDRNRFSILFETKYGHYNHEEGNIGRMWFSGKYGDNLFDEIHNYSLIAKVIARNNEETTNLIHAHDWLTYPAGVAAKEMIGKPLIIHVHATDFDRSGGSVNPRVFEIEKWGMEKADHIICVSNLTRNTVITKYGINPNKVTTIYNAVEPAPNRKEEKATNEEENATNEEEKTPNRKEEKIVTFLGRITMQKGPEYFVEAAKLVLDQTKNVRFVMAGNGDMMEAMIRRAAQLRITDRFSFTGFLQGDEVFEMFQRTDVFVMPSVSEPFGIVPLEAMQSDVPVVISNQSGCSEILEHALKIDYWDTQAMANCIYGLLKYPSLWNTMRREGKKEVNNIVWSKSAAHVLEIYNKYSSEQK